MIYVNSRNRGEKQHMEWITWHSITDSPPWSYTPAFYSGQKPARLQGQRLHDASPLCCNMNADADRPQEGICGMRALELKIPPVALVLLFGVMMWLLSATVPSLALTLSWRTTIAFVLLSAGFAIALAGVLEFRRAKTTVNPLTPEAASVMVTSGIYRYTRNPMYLGLLVTLFGWAVWLSHLLAFALLPLFLLYMNRFQIEPEERALSAKFGRHFSDYGRSVRRWM
jgi:protein-S-isoprenylcysteine O-methyltransferase Ste14